MVTAGKVPKKPRKNWGPVRQRFQQVYDHQPAKPYAIEKLWRCANAIRAKLSQLGRSQAPLDVGSTAYQTHGVIYAICCFRSRKLYVGQTVKTCMDRFIEHVNTALRGDSEPLHQAMRKIGWQYFMVFPLECIPMEEWLDPKGKKSTQRFRALANAREMFWIDYLHSYQTLGFNVQFGERRRRRHHRKCNPMKWRRARRDGPAPIAVPANVAVPAGDERNPQVQLPPGMTPSLRWYGSRDYHRRCVYLAKRSDSGTLDQVQWGNYARHSVTRMLRYLESEAQPDGISNETRDAILTKLRAIVLTRPYLRREKKLRQPFLSVEWNSHLLRRVNLKSILKHDAVLARLPPRVAPFFQDDSFTVVRKLVPPIRGLLFNYASVARRYEQFPPPSDACPCRAFPSRFRPNGGCVLTGDLGIVKDDGLREIVSFGPNFRDRCNGNPLQAVEQALTEFITKRCADSRENLQPVEFFPWKTEVIQRCRDRLSLEYVQKNAKQQPFLDFCARESLKDLKRHLVLVPVDKAADNVAFVCKRLYAQTLRDELRSDSKAYVSENRNVADVVSEHLRVLGPMKLLTRHETRLPYLYWMPKFHKNPIGKRFIAASSQCTTSTCSKLLSDALTFVMRTLRDKDNTEIARTGVRRFFVVENFEEVTEFLSRWQREEDRPGLYSGDFSTMYTAIPHADLVRAIEHATLEAFDWAAKCNSYPFDQVRLRWTRGSCSWIKSDHDHDARLFSYESLNELVKFLINNAFLANGRELWRQQIGIPMGTNCAPVLANLFLYDYEQAYISSLVEAKDTETARAFHMTFRYIDDVLSVDNPHWQHSSSVPHEHGGLYPSALRLNSTSGSNSCVDFIGLRITAERSRFRLSVFDKRDSFPFVVRRYPRMHSLIPSSIPYGTFIGLLHRSYRICSEGEDFIQVAVSTARRLRDNGCTIRRLITAFKTFVFRNVSKYRHFTHCKLVHHFCAELRN